MPPSILKAVPDEAATQGEPSRPSSADTRPQAPLETRRDRNRLGGIRLYSPTVALCTLLLGLGASSHPVAGVMGAAGAGALCILRRRILLVVVALGMLATVALWPISSFVPAFWMLIVLLLAASVAPTRAAPSLLRVAPITWAVCMVLAAASVSGLFLGSDTLASYFIVQGSLCSALLGAGLTRHLAMVDARILTWGEEGLGAVTRDLLLGRITSGMLHDLSQPLNVISMANGNLGYIVEHLEAPEPARQQLLDRIARISSHTESASSILSLFRWFGLSGSQDEAVLSVRYALKRAVAATRSNVRHHGIEVEMEGNALDLPAARQHGRLEMMVVAALLSAFGAYSLPDGERRRGRILLHVSASPAHVVIQVLCTDEEGGTVVGKGLDNATLWLVEQVALEAGGDFRCLAHRKSPAQFVIRLGRDDI